MISLENSSTKKCHYEFLLSLSYEEATQHLLNKHGAVSDDYFRESSYERFLKGEIKSITKGKYSKTSEGLYCHHIDEYKYLNMSKLPVIKRYKYPFESQKKERLTYCDLFEHLILHALIIKETKGTYGVSGYKGYLYPDAEDWYVKNNEPTLEWMRVCKNRAFLAQNDAKELLNKVDEFIEPFVPKFIITEDELAQRKELFNKLLIERKQEEKERKEQKKIEEIARLNEFNMKYPKLSKIGITVGTSRKKILNTLYEYSYSNEFAKRKDFYESKITVIRDELLEELNDLL
ncbi:hypothetical protein FG877_00080 [Enterococcus casseliflavus]|nr:hypothetical protein [Enterococcus casseliflavus]